MRKVIPYKSSQAALRAVDNGGRFYNLLTKANDGVITSAELAKVAGVFGDMAQMHLFLDMSLNDLDDSEAIISALSPELKSSYQQHKPTVITPNQANTDLIGASAIVTGVPHYTTSNDKFTGFIMIPIMVNNVMTFSMIPIIEKYDVYELRDTTTGSDFLIAHTRSGKKLEPVETRVGGFLKELKMDKNKDDVDVFLEACYYTPLLS